MKKIFIAAISLIIFNTANAQQSDSLMIRKIFENAITNTESYNNLEFLCKETPGRLLGTPESYKAQAYLKQYAMSKAFDTVFYQKFQTPAWIHESSSASIILPDAGEIALSVDALGPSAATPSEGIFANAVELFSVNAIDSMGADLLKNKIVFLNRPMKPTFINPFRAYGDAVDQRYWGPVKAAEAGAAGIIVRSMTTKLDDIPHTGSCAMREKKIPAVAISTLDADLLSRYLAEEPGLKLKMRVSAYDTIIESWNLIADIRGKEKPDEIILIGGHIDAWFNTEGAHDDGAGCVQAMDVLRIFKETGMENKRTIRAVMFMDEELYQSGGDAYARYSSENGLNHILAIESDAGAFMPIGMTFDAPAAVIKNLQEYHDLLKPYGGGFLKKGYGGVDIRPLKDLGVPLSGLNTSRQRYYDYHHCKSDTLGAVNRREMQMGTTLLSGLVYLVDKYGL